MRRLDKRVYELYGLTEEELTAGPDRAKAPARDIAGPALFFTGDQKRSFFFNSPSQLIQNSRIPRLSSKF